MVTAGLLLAALGSLLVLPSALEYWAEESLVHGRLERALRLYELLARWYPGRPAAGLYHLQQADIYYYKYGDLPAAVDHYRRALATGKLPGGLASYAHEQLVVIGLYGADRVFFPRFIAVADSFRRGDEAGYKEAIALAQALLADGPPPGLAAETWFLLGESRLRRHEYRQAASAYQEVIRVCPHHRLEADALYGAAYSAEQAGDYRAACCYYDRLAAAYPDTLLGEVGSYSGALLLAEHLKDPVEARRRFAHYLSHYPAGYFAREAHDYIQRLD